MTVLRHEKLNIKSSDLGTESTLPALRYNMGNRYTVPNDSELDEDDGLFIWYGEYPGTFPYKIQDNYDRSEKVRAVDSVVLENDKLKAVFLPDLGAKLWSLYDKKAGNELLFANDIIRPANLAARNAWTSGGIEWNFGYRGHHPYTCSTVFTAETALDDGTPVLRFYWFERARCCIVQMDAFLPEDSNVLYVRSRITNPCKEVVPVYWWTNIAVERKHGDRVIVPATGYYNAEGLNVIKRDIAFNTERDQTYPENGIVAKDYFWTMKSEGAHYTAQLDKDGYGLFEASTSRLVGRKLFIWGDSAGGQKWQRYLTSDGQSGAYDEIQCGLAHTQYECLPMPPHTTWEWLECLGPLSADKKSVHGDYSIAQNEVFSIINDKIGFVNLESLLLSTARMAKSPSLRILRKGDAYGALELLRRSKSGYKSGLMCSHLDFGNANDPETSYWVDLLESGSVGPFDKNSAPSSYMYQAEWADLLKKSVLGADSDNWLAHYLLGTYYFYDDQLDNAKACFIRSLDISENAWSYYCLALLSERKRDKESAFSFIEKARELKPDDFSLNKEYVRILQSTGHHERLINVFNDLPENIRINARCRLILAISLAKSGHVKEAEDILYNEKDGYLLVPDIREGEESLTMLWFEIQRMKGIPADETGDPPMEVDFRMQARKNER